MRMNISGGERRIRTMIKGEQENEDEHQYEEKRTRKETATGVECHQLVLLLLLQLVKELLLLDGVDGVGVDAQHGEAQNGAHHDVVPPLQCQLTHPLGILQYSDST